MGSLRVMRAGLHTTVQDLGRWGFQAQGVPVCGAMDPFSHRAANALVGNARRAATLEIALTGPTLLFDSRRVIAVAGAAFDLEVDGEPRPHGRAFMVEAGSTLRFGQRRSGARAYLGLSGGIDVPAVLGSRSTHVPSRLGGVGGRALVPGDYIPLGNDVQSRPSTFEISPRGGDDRPGSVRIVAAANPQRFAVDAIDMLQSAPYRVEPNSDRMGFRLSGPAIGHAAGADIISDATPIGTIQVPASGQPILLMADRQTTGGYAAVATVISADIGLAAQVPPGGRLEFHACTPAQALVALIAAERALLAIEAARS